MNDTLRELPALQLACAGQITATHFEVNMESGIPNCPD